MKSSFICDYCFLIILQYDDGSTTIIILDFEKMIYQTSDVLGVNNTQFTKLTDQTERRT